MDIKIPSKNYLKYNWDSLIRLVLKSNAPDDIRLDLSAVEFMRPETVIMLIALSHKIYTLSSHPVEWVNLNAGVHSYLHRLDIDNISFIKIPTIRKNFIWNRSKNVSANLMELQIIRNAKDCADTMKRIKEILVVHFPERISNGFCKALPILISEIAGNSLEHSSTNHKGVCYFLAQKYLGSRGKNVVVAFGDCGMGVRNSLKIHNDWLVNDDVYALKKAFMEGVTARLDKSGGLGFQRVKSVLHDYTGEITIRSGKGVISYNPHQTRPLETSRFYEALPGTQTVLIL